MDKVSTEKLKERLRQKIDEKNISRTSLEVRETQIEKLEARLKRTKDRSERLRIRKRLELLQEIRERELTPNDPDPTE